MTDREELERLLDVYATALSQRSIESVVDARHAILALFDRLTEEIERARIEVNAGLGVPLVDAVRALASNEYKLRSEATRRREERNALRAENERLTREWHCLHDAVRQESPEMAGRIMGRVYAEHKWRAAQEAP